MTAVASENGNEPGKFLADPYGDWTAGEGIPIHHDFGHDLLALETGPWARYDAQGCFAHTHGMGDFMANYVLEVLPGRKTSPVQHVYEAHFYVLAGHGSTTVWLPSGEAQTFEWGPRALFAVPLNCRYQIFNGSGSESIRLSCTNDAPLMMNLIHSEDFIFDNPFGFPERAGTPKHFDGDGDYTKYDLGAGRAANVWETNFVNDLTSFTLYELEDRGKGSTNVAFVLADGTVHAHVSQIPVGRYKKAHRHEPGAHVHAVDGEGYSLLWYDGDSEFKEFPWKHGFMYTPPYFMFHQHFNTSGRPARYLACTMGSRRYPLIASRRAGIAGGGSTSVREGGLQIEYEDQDPRIHRKFLDAIAESGVPSRMGDLFDEEAIMALPPEALQGAMTTPTS